ncbi:MAG TPA: hypothetical protein VF737_14845 [Gemmatimonadaceae bacterium]
MKSQTVVHDGVKQAEYPARVLLWLAGLALATLALTASPARAQRGGSGFLFGVPDATLTLRTGYDIAFANSDLFSFATTNLTLNRSDFSSPTIAGDLGFRLSPRVMGTVSLGYSRSAAQSEFRNWLDNNNLPIQQSTELTRVPLTFNLKAYLRPPGRAIGHYAWVPAAFAPYVGAGVGTMWYKFRQGGDFVDTVSTNVYSDVYSTSAWTPMANVFIGGDWNISPGMALTAEARYSWAQGPVSGDYSGFHRIDLSGVALTAGLTFRY